MNRVKLVYASAWGAIASAVFIVVVTIRAELSAPLKEWLTGLTGHHWTAKSVLSLLVFVVVACVVALLPYEPEARCVRCALTALLNVVIFGTLGLLGFFSLHSLGVW